jgi:hypothetical protein
MIGGVNNGIKRSNPLAGVGVRRNGPLPQKQKVHVTPGDFPGLGGGGPIGAKPP